MVGARCAVLPRPACARPGGCRSARLRCPGLGGCGQVVSRMYVGLLSLERAVCTWGSFPWGCPM